MATTCSPRCAPALARLFLAPLGLAICAQGLLAQTHDAPPDELLVSPQAAFEEGEEVEPGMKASDEVPDWDLAELLQVEVTSLNLRSEPLTRAAAAIFVLSPEDLRRLGAETVPDALRFVPGMDVGHGQRGSWSVSARGLSKEFANHMQVSRDGQSIYNPTFSGVLWDTESPLFDDLERIEIIRGPGGTTWGSNAVNGVIDMITRPASQTQGWLLRLGTGTEAPYDLALRYGDAFGDDLGHWRITAQLADHDGGARTEGGEAADDLRTGSLSWRGDFTLGSSDVLQVQAELRRARRGDESPLYAALSPDGSPFDTVRHERAELMLTWTRWLDSGDSLRTRWFSQWARIGSFLDAEGKNLIHEASLQHTMGLGERTDFVWGAHARFVSESITESVAIRSLEPERNLQTYTLFGQATHALLNERLHLTAGVRLEHTPFTGIEVQPTARATWTPSEELTLWGAVSRAVRTPSSASNSLLSFFDLRQDPRFPFPLAIQTVPNPEQDSEVLWAYEAGLRWAITPRWSLDLALFHNDYSKFTSLSEPSFTPTLIGGVPYLLVGSAFANDRELSITGGELALSALPWQGARLHASWSYKTGSQKLGPTADPRFNEPELGALAEHQARLWLFQDLGSAWELNAGLWTQSTLRTPRVSSIVRLDANLVYEANEHLTATIGVRNALDDRTRESSPTSAARLRSEAERMLWASVTLRF